MRRLAVVLFILFLIALAYPFVTHGQVSGFSPWKLTGTVINPQNSTWTLRVPSLASCDTIDTDASGNFSCGTDSTGGSAGVPNLIYRTLSNTKFYTASSSATNNLAWHFNNGFISSGASSTINDNLYLGGILHASSSPIYASSSVSFANSFFWDANNRRLSLRDPENEFGINGLTVGSVFSVHAEEANDLLTVGVHRHADTATFAPNVVLTRSRGTEGTESAVQNGDTLGILAAHGFDGTDYAKGGQIFFKVDGTPGNDDLPTSIGFYVSADGSQTPTERLRINSSGLTSIFSGLTASSTVHFDKATSTAFATNSFNLGGSHFTSLTGTGLSVTGGVLNAEVQASDLHDAVTLAGTPDYITLSGQVITRNKLDISDDTNATGGTGLTITANDFSFDCSEVEGTGIDCVGEAITLDATGAWTGTFDGLEGSAYLARANHTGTQAASTITGGTFGSGNYTFPSNLTISGSATTTNLGLTGKLYSTFTGTSTLSGKLNVQGSIYASGSGLVGNPSYSFNDAHGTGIWEQFDTLRFGVNGTQELAIDSTTATFAGSALFADGDVSTAGFGFANDADVGLYRPGNNILGFTLGGAERARLNSTGFGIATTTFQKKFNVEGNGILTGTFTTGPIIGTSTIQVKGLASCDTIDTDSDGNFSCGTDATGGSAGVPNLIYRKLSNTKYYTASTSASDNLAFHFNNGFVSSASSTVAGPIRIYATTTLDNKMRFAFNSTTTVRNNVSIPSLTQASPNEFDNAKLIGVGSKGIILGGSSPSLQILSAEGPVAITKNTNLFNTGLLFANQLKFFATTSVSIGPVLVLADQPNIVAFNAASTQSLETSVNSAPKWRGANGGSIVVAEHRGFSSSPAIFEKATLTKRIGLNVGDVSTSTNASFIEVLLGVKPSTYCCGNVTENIGLNIDNFLRGNASTTWSIRSGVASSTFTGAITIGSSTAPFSKNNTGSHLLEVYGNVVLGNNSTTTAKTLGVPVGGYQRTANTPAQLRFMESRSQGSNYVGFRAPSALSGNQIWTLPTADGTNGQVLQTNGSGKLSWATAGGGDTFVKARKTANEDVTSSATLQNDDHLTLSLSANTSYIIDGEFHASSGSSNPDLKYAFTVPSGATLDIDGECFQESGTNIRNITHFETSGADSGLVAIVAGAGVNCKFSGSVSISSTAGSLTLQWAQNSSDATATTIEQGGFIRAHAL